MHRVSKRQNSMKGFTLIELLLAIAIMLIFVSAIFATFSIINTSHARVALINNAKDYAALNMDAIENLIVNANAIKFCSQSEYALNATDISSKYAGSISYNTSSRDGVLYLDKGSGRNAAFTYSQYKLANTENKWSIQPIFSVQDNMVQVELKVMDNSKSSSDPAYYILRRTIYLPNNPTFDGSSGPVLKFGLATFED